jgi:hypothetical protein
MKSKLFKEERMNPLVGTEGLHFVVTQDSAGDTVLHVFDSEDQAGLYHGQLRGYGGVKRIGRAKGSKGMSLGQVNERVLKQFGAEPRMMRHDLGETNPARRPKESPLYVKYLSLKSGEEPFMMQGTKYEYVWAEYPGGIKDIGVYSYANDLVYSYDSFRQMMNLPNPVTRRKGESSRDFVSRCMSEEKMSFPKTKQRIAVCLSKSRKRNPVYDTGSDE